MDGGVEAAARGESFDLVETVRLLAARVVGLTNHVRELEQRVRELEGAKAAAPAPAKRSAK